MQDAQPHVEHYSSTQFEFLQDLASHVQERSNIVEIRVAASDLVQCHCNIGKSAAKLQLKPPCQTVL